MTRFALTRDQLTATVRAADGTRFVSSSPSAVTLAKQLAGYVRERCDDVLWPSVAAEVHSLIDSGQIHAAIATYFANVGQRWDAEELELTGPPFDDATDAHDERRDRPRLRMPRTGANRGSAARGRRRRRPLERCP